MPCQPPLTSSSPEAPAAHAPSPTALPDEMRDALREHLGVCNALLELAHKEAEALKNPAPFPALAIQVERKALLTRLECALRLLGQKRTLWNRSGITTTDGNPQLTRLLQTALDTIMRVLVLDRENQQQLLRRGLLPARSLPPAQQCRPHFVAALYQRHTLR
ncbi:MAG: hypothetical protein ABSF95_06690 [Verrucomicrobiota bacterium]